MPPIEVASINSVRLSLATPALTRALAIQETTPATGGVNSVALGSSSPNTFCPACGNFSPECKNHQGAMSLPAPVTNPETTQHIVKVLRCVCWHCSRLLIPTSVEKFPKDMLQNLTQRPGKMDREDLKALIRMLSARSDDRATPAPMDTDDICEEVQPGDNDDEEEDDDGEDEEEEPDEPDDPEDEEEAQEPEDDPDNSLTEQHIEPEQEQEHDNDHDHEHEEEEDEEAEPELGPDPDPSLDDLAGEDRFGDWEDDENLDEFDDVFDDDKDGERRKSKRRAPSANRSRAVLRTTQNQLDSLVRILRSTSGLARLKELAEISERVRVCGCGHEQPLFSVVGNSIKISPRVPKKDEQPAPVEKPKGKPPQFLPKSKRKPVEDEEIANNSLLSLNSVNFYYTLCRIPEDDARILGFTPQHSRPADLMFSVLPVSPPCIRPKVEFCDSEELRGQSELTKTLDRICKTTDNLRKHAAEFQEHFEFLVKHGYQWAGRWQLLPFYLYLTELDTYWLSRLGTHYYTKHRARGKSAAKRQADVTELEDTGQCAAIDPDALHERELMMRVALRDFEFKYGQLHDQVSNMFASPSKGAKQGQRGSYQNPGTSFRDRLGSKGGLFRKYITAKRRVRSGRAVISPDHEAHIAWAGVPQQMAMTLTYTETVTEFNIHRLTRMVHNGPNNYPGANFVIRPTEAGEETRDLRFGKDHTQIVLQPGWKVERHAITGDPALFNRQPSLHRMNIAMMYIWVSDKFKVLKIPLACTPAMAADFDGDEMTYHALNDPEARAEALLMLSELHITSPKNGAPVYAPVFDTALGPALMSEDHIKFDMQTAHGFLGKLNPKLMPPGRNFDAALKLLHHFDKPRQQAMALALQTIEGRVPTESLSVADIDLEFAAEHLNDPAIAALLRVDSEQSLVSSKRIPGQLVLSCILPATLNLKLDKRTSIKCGKLSGPLTRSSLLTILGVIHRMYGAIHSANFLYNLQVFANEFLSFHGCSMGLDDLRVDRTKTDALVARAMAWIDARGPPQNEDDEQILQDVLQEVRERAGKWALKELLKKSEVARNGALEIVRTGTKGNNTTIVETGILVGQLFADSERLTGKLPIYHDDELKHDSAKKTGFITSGYHGGLGPVEFFFSAMSSRHGQTDTATKTCTTGYIARKLTKGLEGITIDFKGFVRASNGDLLGLAFGGDSFDGMYVLKTRLELLSLSEREVRAMHEVPNNPQLSSLILEDLLMLRKIFLRSCVLENRRDNLVAALGPMEPLAALATQEDEDEPGSRCDADDPILTMAEIWTQVHQNVVERILSHHKKHRKTMPLAFLATVLEAFSPRKLEGTTRKKLQVALDTLVALHSRAMIQPRTQVGIIAGQSVGEPTTQLTLQSSHNIGHKVNLGVSRVNEIICGQPTEKMATPVMEFYVDAPNKGAVQRLCKQVLGALFEDVVTLAETSFDSTFEVRPQELSLGKLARAIHGQPALDNNNNNNNNNESLLVLRFEVDKGKCAALGLSPAAVADKILLNVFGKKSDVTVVLDPDFARDKFVLRFELAPNDKVLLDALKKLTQQQRPKKLETLMEKELEQNGPLLMTHDSEDDGKEAGGEDVRNELQFPLDMLKHRILGGSVIAGVKRITAARVSHVDALDMHATLEFGLDNKQAMKKKFKMQTVGSDLSFLINLAVEKGGIEWTTCMTNSIREVHKTLGIAAASIWIDKQLQEVLSSNGSRVHSRYTTLVAQAMTKDGTVQAFGRYGVIKQQRSVLARAGFELAVKVLMEGAMTAEIDDLTGITEAVITGQKPRIGTAQVEVFSATSTLFDLWQLQPVFTANRESFRKRRVRGAEEPELSEQDLDLFRSVKADKTKVDLKVPSRDNGWQPRSPNWGKYSVEVLRFATSRQDIERLHNAANGIRQRGRKYEFGLAAVQ